jgi:hypothetical protein
MKLGTQRLVMVLIKTPMVFVYYALCIIQVLQLSKNLNFIFLTMTPLCTLNTCTAIVYGAMCMKLGIQRIVMVLIKTPIVRTTIHALWVSCGWGGAFFKVSPNNPFLVVKSFLYCILKHFKAIVGGIASYRPCKNLY